MVRAALANGLQATCMHASAAIIWLNFTIYLGGFN